MKHVVNRKYVNRFLALFMAVSVIMSNFTGSSFAKTEEALSAVDELVYEGVSAVSGNDALTNENVMVTVSGGDVSGGDAIANGYKIMLLADQDENVYVTPEGQKVVYFDLSLGSVTLDNNNYKGTVNRKDHQGNIVKAAISGEYNEDYIYYVFQSGSSEDAKGYVTLDAAGNVNGVKLPVYGSMAFGGKESWGEYITNNTEILNIINAWETTAEAANRTKTSYKIDINISGVVTTEYYETSTGTVAGGVKISEETADGKSVCKLTLDNIWSSYQDSNYGGININKAYSKRVDHKTDKTLTSFEYIKTAGVYTTIDLVGNNRIGKLFYATGVVNNGVDSDSSLTLRSSNGKGTLTAIGDQTNKKGNASYVGYDAKNNPKNVPYNNWNSVIGGSDGIDQVNNLILDSGTIYAGSMPLENCTTIGGGGNGKGVVTINNAAVTAVAYTTGTAIGGGIAHQSSGGPGNITINGGKVFAYNFGQPAYETVKDWGSLTEAQKAAAKQVPGTAIGGGGSIKSNGSAGTVTIKGGEVYAQSLGGSAIGGGGTCVGSGGSATVTISGGTVWAKSTSATDYYNADTGNGEVPYDIAPGVAIGGGTGGINGNGGTATVTISEESGNTKLTAGSIGGGSTDNANGTTGHAVVTIKGGEVTGQVVMAKPGGNSTQYCTFTMSGGSLGESPVDYLYTKPDGGAVWIDDPKGVANVSNGSIIATNSNRNAVNGGAVYMTGGKLTLSGSGKIIGWDAQNNGGAIYLGATDANNKGTFEMNGGAISGNLTTNGLGGAIYLDGGNATIKNGVIQNNAARNGGGAYLKGGTLKVEGGSFDTNIATADGGGAYVNDGNVNMTGGSFVNNEASADGGGVYITGGNFTMNGEAALIQGNKAVMGAGVYLTGGDPLLQSGILRENIASQDGGGIFIDQKIVELSPVAAVNITANKAGHYGAGICIVGTNGTDAGFSVDGNSTGMVNITENIADEANGIGGGVCVDKGFFTVDSNKILLKNNSAYNGGGVAVVGGNFNLSDSEISYNTASNLGGGVMVDGGNAVFSGGILDAGGVDTGSGSVIFNIAENGGGGIAVKNGNVIMSAGTIDDNTVNNGDGGGLYVESTGSNVSVKVYSGSVSRNKAYGGNGGAVAVVGQSGNTESIAVQIGVNEDHAVNLNGEFAPFEHTADGKLYYHTECPVLNDNLSGKTGGACYITGSNQTQLNVFCLVETGNIAEGDTDINGEHLSDFMMVAGGKVVISTAEDDDSHADHGYAMIKDSIHITGGELELHGTMDNPHFEKHITIDIEQGEGSFSDYREPIGCVKLLYNENFVDPVSHEVNSTLTAFQVDQGGTEIISKNLYAHSGYTIKGWYTSPSQSDPDGEWFYADTVCRFYVAGTSSEDIDSTGKYHVGDLTLYAIWEVNGYTVVFHPNTGKETHQGQMNNMGFAYDQVQELNKNAYVWPGHVFLGWNTKSDGTGVSYADQESVSMLSDVNGATVDLYAQWEECEHIRTEKGDGTYSVNYTVDVISANQKKIIKTCDCGYRAEILFAAEDGKYNGNSKYTAELTCQDSNWQLEEADITYAAVKIDDQSLPLDPEENWSYEDAGETLNAGYYTATIELDKATGLQPESGAVAENIISVAINYTIHKAEQAAPDKPEFKPVTDGASVTQLQVSLLGNSAIGTEPSYVMEYYEGDETKRSVSQDNTNAVGGYVNFTVETTYTNYCVFAWYKGTDNYKRSPETKSNSFFYYTGNTDILIDAETGIKGVLTEVSGGVDLAVAADSENGYYISDRVDISGIEIVCQHKNGGTNTKIPELDNLTVSGKVAPLTEKEYVITNIPEDNIITIHLTGARRIPRISSSVDEGQIYGEVIGESAIINNDSAYTVHYSLTAYDTADYEVPILVFDRKLPDKTNLIMKDMTDNTYWYCSPAGHEVDGNTGISLTSFRRMGSTDVYYQIKPKIDTYTDVKLQFVVDFSEETTTAGNIVTTLLVANKKDGVGNKVSNAPNLTDSSAYPEAKVTTTAVQSSFSLHKKAENELETALMYQYTVGGEASKWQHRQEVLILTVDPNTPLPTDAIIYAKVKEYWSYFTRICSGDDVKFVIPLGDVEGSANDVILQLQSDMFPPETRNYRMTAQLGMALSVAEDAGINAEPQGEAVDITFTNTAFKPVVKISWDGRNEAGEDVLLEQRAFVNGEVMRLLVDYKQLPNDNLFEIKTSVLQEAINDYNEKEYIDTAVSQQLVTISVDESGPETFVKASCEVAFNNYAPGNYCLMVRVTRGGYIILEAPYYFIIKDEKDKT